MGLATWMGKAISRWKTALPRCQDENCSRAKGLWRRLCGRHGGIWLHESWYCAPQCFEAAVQQRFARASVTAVPAPPSQHRFPLGLLMLSRGQLTNSQLRSALEAQRMGGRGPIGRWLEQLGFASEQQVTAALGLQWACPILPPFAAEDCPCAAMLPFRLLETYRMLPVRFVVSSRTLYVAFSEGVDYTALFAIEQMLGCRTEACLLNHSTMERTLERIGHQRRPGEIIFEGWREFAEMARISSGYALKLGARQARIITCGEHIWVRLEREQDLTNLLFRRPTAQSTDHQASQRQDAAFPKRATG